MSLLFEEYQNRLKSSLKKEQTIDKTHNSSKISAYLGGVDRNRIQDSFKDINYLAESTQPSTISGGKQALTFNFDALEKVFGKNPDSFNQIRIGDHPDFSDLGYNQELEHFCVSTFIDIKGSTSFIKKYSLSRIRYIKDSILTLCIYIANFFGGHVQRLQGDGIFVQFVRKDRHHRDAIINALNATSVILQFVKNDLSKILSDQGIEPVKVRVGIDYGGNDKVLWSHYGIPNCSELTTTSLHTDLAAKLQARARSNKILIGDNVKTELDLPDSFISVPEKRGSSTDKDYCIINDPRYNMYEFNWENYLNTLQFFQWDDNRTHLNFEKPDVFLECHIAPKETQDFQIYGPNIFGIPKEYDIKFKIRKNDRYVKDIEVKSSEWKALNTGKEAERAGHLEHDFGGSFNNRSYCNTSSAYLGHHIAECKLKRKAKYYKEKLRFPIFIK